MVREQLGKPQLKLIQEVETRWNSSYNILQRLFQQIEPVGAALGSLTIDISPISSEEYGIISECLIVLEPFNNATTELSQGKKKKKKCLPPRSYLCLLWWIIASLKKWKNHHPLGRLWLRN